jgi:L-amino acid N-acyltransferase YncA
MIKKPFEGINEEQIAILHALKKALESLKNYPEAMNAFLHAERKMLAEYRGLPYRLHSLLFTQKAQKLLINFSGDHSDKNIALHPGGIVIREATESDMDAVRAIYEHYVLHSTASLEEVPPDAAELNNRRIAIMQQALPYLVAEYDGRVAGYAYAAAYRPRSGYRFTVENSVYVSKEYVGKKIGCKLLTEVITRCEAGGYKQMLAVIAGTDNHASIAFHERMGFTQSGILKGFGFKFGKWVDTILMQRPLNGGTLISEKEEGGQVLDG